MNLWQISIIPWVLLAATLILAVAAFVSGVWLLWPVAALIGLMNVGYMRWLMAKDDE